MDQRIEKLQSMPYGEYLQTPEWAEKREQALARDGRACRLCGSRQHLEVHHRTYARRGNEQVNDLTTLCASCHENFHQKVRQSEIMAQTYNPPMVVLSKEAQRQQWEDFMIGMLLEVKGLLAHVCGILSPGDFAGDETRALYQALLSGQQPPLDMASTVSRCRKEARASLTTDASSQVKMAVMCAIRVKRTRLLQLNAELSALSAEAENAGETAEARQMQLQQLEIAGRIRTLMAAMHLGG